MISAGRREDEALDDGDRKENCVGISCAADFEAGLAQMRGQTFQVISPLDRDGVVMAASHPLICSHANKGEAAGPQDAVKLSDRLSIFVIGNKVKGGIYGRQPSLAVTDLDDSGNAKFNVDFRSVYATILDGWLGGDSKTLLGGQFENMGFLA